MTVTNVPGPQVTLYAFGAPLRDVVPVVPLAAEHGIGVAVISYDRGVAFGVNVDRDSVPDVDVVLDGIRESIAELSAVSVTA